MCTPAATMGSRDGHSDHPRPHLAGERFGLRQPWPGGNVRVLPVVCCLTDEQTRRCERNTHLGDTVALAQPVARLRMAPIRLSSPL
jgi:hypothetical protein